MNKIFLYSDQEIPENSKIDNILFEEVKSKNISLAYIPSKSDPLRKYFNKKISYYKKYNINNFLYFDLGDEWNANKKDDLFKCDIIHLAGGDTYRLLYNLNKRKMVSELIKYVNKGGVLVGISAGAIVLTPKIDIIYITEQFDRNKINKLSTLELVNFEFFPHYENKYDSLIKDYCKKNNTIVFACKDGDGIFINDNKVNLIGNIKIFA